MGTYLADYEDCITLMLNSDIADLETRRSHMESRLQMLDKGSEALPWNRLCKVGVYIHWGIIHMRFGEQFKAALRFRKAFLLLKENERLFPDFEYNEVFLGLSEAVAGSLPGNYKWLASIFGVRGNVRTGTEHLHHFISSHNEQQPLRSETVLYYLFVKFYLMAQQGEVWSYLNSSEFQSQDNLLYTFSKVNMAMNYHKSAVALQALRAAARNVNYVKYPIFDYLTGTALLENTDTACLGYFRQYIKRSKSLNYMRDSWLRMAYAYYIAGDMPRAEYHRQQINLNGAASLDVDKQAQRFGESKIWPGRKLLEARLLADGGAYEQAFALLRSINISSLTNPADKAEYLYRLGQVYEQQGSNKKALEFYEYAVNTGKERHEQFAARALLQMGRIYEREGLRAQAVSKYEECLAMPSHDFQNSIDHQAKSGISRLQAQ